MNKLIHRFGNWIKDIDPETYVSDKQRIAELEAERDRLRRLLRLFEKAALRKSSAIAFEIKAQSELQGAHQKLDRLQSLLREVTDNAGVRIYCSSIEANGLAGFDFSEWEDRVDKELEKV